MGPFMDRLRTSLHKLADDSAEIGRPIAMAAWDDMISWAIFEGRYIEPGDKLYLESWLADLQPGGGTYIRQALESATEHCPNMRLCIIMTDGDFSDPYSHDEWAEMCGLYPNVRFDFVAFNDAPVAKLREMARIANGTCMVAK
jgi:hypothetical protein